LKHIDGKGMEISIYQSLDTSALHDAIIGVGVEYSMRKMTLNIDFEQNIKLPCNDSDQPGCTNYYIPMTANNFGIVNHNHDYIRN
jgi:hypothetical protein